MNDITNFLPQYRELNATISAITNSGGVSYADQCLITDYYNEFNDLKVFERILLDFVIAKERSFYEPIFSRLLAEIKQTISLYQSKKELLDSIDIKSACKEKTTKYASKIEIQLAKVNEYSSELNKVNGSLDAIGFRKHTPEEEQKLWQQHAYFTKRYSEEKNKLASLFAKQEESRQESARYRENLFERIYNLSLSFQGIINSYLTTEPMSKTDTTIAYEGDVTQEVKLESIFKIEPDMIFRVKMFEKLVALEKRLIDDKYLNENLHWIATHENGKADIKRLVTFLVALIDNNYFLPNRIPKIKIFFESRYNITIGQNFEKKRRESLLSEYKVVFYDYSF